MKERKPTVWTDLESVIEYARSLGPGRAVMQSRVNTVYVIIKSEDVSKWSAKSICYETK